MRRAGQPWRPLLRGEVAGRAREAIDAIAGALREPWTPWAPAGISEQGLQVASASLAAGSAGIALFYAYLAGSDRGDQAALATSNLERAMDAVGSLPMAPALFAGFSGVAWTVEHLARRFRFADEDPVEGVDEALRELLAGPVELAEYDLISGSVGLGMYALERLPRPIAAECLALVLDRLEKLAEPVAPGLAWPSPPDRSPERADRGGRYNLGVAHGVPGVIALLGLTWAAAPALRPRAEKLLAPAVDFLLAQRLPGTRGRRYPYAAGPGASGGAARSAWCYGDAGVAATLHLAARCVGEPTWAEAALELAREAAALTPGEAQVHDACLCHGSAGLGHIYNRLWQQTGDERLEAEATRWFEHALSLRQPGHGPGGFQARVAGKSGLETADDPGLLMGSAGIGLALIAAIGDREPTWDSVLALSRREDGP